MSAPAQDHLFDDLRGTLHEYGRILRLRWRLGLLGLSLVGAVAFWWSQFLPREYQVRTLFERRDDPVLQNLIDQNSPYSFANLKSSLQIDMTGSRALAQAAIACGLLPPDAVRSQTGALNREELAAIDRVLGRYELRPSVRMMQSTPSLDTIEVQVRANDPRIAARFATALRDGYIERTRAYITALLHSAKQFFDGELRRHEQAVDSANSRLQQLLASYPGIDPANPLSIVTKLDTLRAEHARRAAHVTELGAQIDAREQFLVSAADGATVTAPEPAPPPPPSPARLALDQEIQTLETQLADMVTIRQMTSEHPDVRTARRKLSQLQERRAQLDAVPPAAVTAAGEPLPDPAWSAQRARIRLELEALRAQRSHAEEQAVAARDELQRYEGLQTRLLASSDELQSLRQAVSDQSATATVWRAHATQLDRILAAESEERGTRFGLIEEPKQGAATNPRLSSIFGVSGGLGLAAALVLIALSELFDRSFRSISQVARGLGLPVLTAVGAIATPRERRARWLRRLIWAPTLSVSTTALVLAAFLAWASLARPELHDATLARLGGFNPFGAQALAPPPQPRTGG